MVVLSNVKRADKENKRDNIINADKYKIKESGLKKKSSKSKNRLIR